MVTGIWIREITLCWSTVRRGAMEYIVAGRMFKGKKDTRGAREMMLDCVMSGLKKHLFRNDREYTMKMAANRCYNQCHMTLTIIRILLFIVSIFSFSPFFPFIVVQFKWIIQTLIHFYITNVHSQTIQSHSPLSYFWTSFSHLQPAPQKKCLFTFRLDSFDQELLWKPYRTECRTGVLFSTRLVLTVLRPQCHPFTSWRSTHPYQFKRITYSLISAFAAIIFP